MVRHFPRHHVVHRVGPRAAVGIDHALGPPRGAGGVVQRQARPTRPRAGHRRIRGLNPRPAGLRRSSAPMLVAARAPQRSSISIDQQVAARLLRPPRRPSPNTPYRPAKPWPRRAPECSPACRLRAACCSRSARPQHGDRQRALQRLGDVRGDQGNGIALAHPPRLPGPRRDACTGRLPRPSYGECCRVPGRVSSDEPARRALK